MELKRQLIEIVREFREASGLKQDDENLHSKLFAEEHAEYHEATTNNNLVEKADALADMAFVSAGGIVDGFETYNNARLDSVIFTSENEEIDLLRATKTVFDSNMSKLCSRDEIKPTADKYAAIGVAVHFEPVDELDESAGFRCICSESVISSDGKEYPKGKLLKSVGYRSPDWSYLGEVA